MGRTAQDVRRHKASGFSPGAQRIHRRRALQARAGGHDGLARSLLRRRSSQPRHRSSRNSHPAPNALTVPRTCTHMPLPPPGPSPPSAGPPLSPCPGPFHHSACPPCPPPPPSCVLPVSHPLLLFCRVLLLVLLHLLEAEELLTLELVKLALRHATPRQAGSKPGQAARRSGSQAGKHPHAPA